MTLATRTAPQAGSAIAMLLAIALAAPGCARLRPFRDEPRPSFGTESSRVDPPAEVGDRSFDPYLDGLRSSRTARVEPSREARDMPAPPDRLEDADGSVRSAEPRSQGERSRGNAPAIPDTIEEAALASPSTRLVRQSDPRAGSARPTASTPPRPADATSKAASPSTSLAGLITRSRRRVDELSTYQVTMRYQERVAGTLQPLDEALLSIRKHPKRVRIEWRQGASKGREVIYASDLHDGLMHVRMGGVMSALPRISMKPDSPIASRSSRHPITEAGFDTIVTRMEEGLREISTGATPKTRLSYLGLEQPAGLSVPCHKIERITPTGEVWLVYLDPQSYLPVNVQALASNGELLEHYTFAAPTENPPELADEMAFDPDARWGRSQGGLLQRLARSANPDSRESPTNP